MINYLSYSALALLLGILLDALIGDPKEWYHPVRAIGWLISWLETVLRRLFPKTKQGELAAGLCLAVLAAAVPTMFALLVLVICYRIHPAAGIGAETAMCGSLLAVKSLKTESIEVMYALETGGLNAARKAVSRIVGRDTQRLDEEGVIRAAIETVAENTSDGVVAPLIFMALFGGAGGFFYKSVNTMDSMVGYRNRDYQYFGTAAARLDDILNFIPARISALLMIAASGLCKNSVRGAYRIFLRDRKKHDSPNSAQTEAVMAGALQIRLAGDAWYSGKKYEKPLIGDDIRPVEPKDIARSCTMMQVTAVLAFLFVLLVKYGIILCCV